MNHGLTFKNDGAVKSLLQDIEMLLSELELTREDKLNLVNMLPVTREDVHLLLRERINKEADVD